MKLLVPKIELRTLKTLCSQQPEASAYLLASISEKSFHYPPALEAYKRIRLLVKKNTEIPIWDEIINDPTIDEDNRSVLQKYKTKSYTSKEQATKAFKILDKYRKHRQAAFLAQNIMAKLQKKAVDLDKLFDEISSDLTKMKTSSDKSDNFFRLGINNNTTKLAKRVLTKDAVHYIPTGFKVFDSINRGFAKKSCVMLAASTSAGKTTVSQQILTNMALYGAKVCYVPLEMDENEVMQRRYANLCDVSMTDIIDPENRLRKAQRDKMFEQYKRYIRSLKKKGAAEHYFIPPEDMSIEEICFILKPYGYDTIIIDYLGLAGGLMGDNQWKTMDEAVRFTKIFAKNTDTLMITSAQLTEEMTTRFSKSLFDHCNNAWRWTYSDSNIVMIDQPKARQQKRFKFPLWISWDTMRVRDLKEEELSLVSQMEANVKNDNKPSSFAKEKKRYG